MIEGAYCTPSPRIDPDECLVTPSPSPPLIETVRIVKRGKFSCNFCKQNGEPVERYTSHPLRDYKSGIVICPVLRSHVCQFCQETGDFSHTISYCKLAQTFKPIVDELHGDDAFSSNMGELRKTYFSAAGQRTMTKKTLQIKLKALGFF